MKKTLTLFLLLLLVVSLISCIEPANTDKDSETTEITETDPITNDTTGPSETTKSNDTSEEEPTVDTTETIAVTDPVSETAEDTTAPPETEEVTTAHKHSYSLSSSRNSTCTEKGEYIYSCSCGKSYSEEIEKLPHEYSLSSAKKSTCTDKGSKTYSCSCGKSYSEEIDLLDHDYIPATCTAPKTCSVCGHNGGGQLPHDVVDSVCTLCGKEVLCLGVTEAELIEMVGDPDDRIVENTTSGEVTTFIYSNNMMKLRFYQLCGGKVTAIFSAGEGYIYCHMPTKKTHIPIAYDENMKLISDGNMDILCFTDITGSKKMTSSWAKLSNFDYGLNTMKDEITFKEEDVTDYSAQNLLCLYITNYYRALNGLSPLEYSGEASAASLTHSIDMAKTGYFEHADLDGNRASYRLRNEGIDGVYCGENIQAGYFYIGGIKTTNVFFVTHCWYTSPSHREVMLTPEYKYFGAGFAYYSASQYEYYSTQVFYRYP